MAKKIQAPEAKPDDTTTSTSAAPATSGGEGAPPTDPGTTAAPAATSTEAGAPTQSTEATATSTSEAPAAPEAPAPEAETNAAAPSTGSEDDQVNESSDEPIVKAGFYKVTARNFRGSFKDAQFDDNGVCDRISEETLRQLSSEFPKLDVVEVVEL